MDMPIYVDVYVWGGVVSGDIATACVDVDLEHFSLTLLSKAQSMILCRFRFACTCNVRRVLSYSALNERMYLI